jgi:WD40 repeat protein
MSVPFRVLLLGVLLCGVAIPGMGAGQAPRPDPPGRPGAEARPARDLYGDPLPPGALARLGTVRLRHGHTVQNVVFSPDGKLVASAGHDHLVRLWDVATASEVRSFGSHDEVGNPFASSRWPYSVAFSPDGKTLAVGYYVSGWGLKAALLFNVADARELHRLELAGSGGMAVAFAAGGKELLTATREPVVQRWEVSTGQELQRKAPPPREALVDPSSIPVFSPDGTRLAAGSSGGAVLVWDALAEQAARTLDGHRQQVLGVAFSPDGKHLVSGGDDKTVRIWDARTGKALRTIERARPIQSVAFSPDGKMIAAGEGPEVVLLDAGSGKELRRLTGPDRDVRSLAFSPDGKHLAATAVQHNSLFLWEATGKNLDSRPGHQGNHLGLLAYARDGLTITSVGGDGTVRQWDPATGRQLRVLDMGQTNNHAADLSADGKTLVAGRPDGSLLLLDLASGKELRLRDEHKGMVTAVAFAPDGKTVASAGQDRAVCLWDVDGGVMRPVLVKEKLRVETNGGGETVRVVFAPDGKLLAALVRGGMPRLLDLTSGKWGRPLTLAQDEQDINTPGSDSVAFSPDGRLLAVGDRDGTVRLYEAATGTAVRRLPGHTGWVLGLAFAPDGRTLAVGNWRNVRLWEMATGQERKRLDGHEGDVAALAFAPDGRTLATGGSDTTGLVWDLTGRLDGGKLRPVELTPAGLDKAWSDLGGDPVRAYAALWLLAATPQSLPLLREALPPVVPVEDKRLRRLIADLDDDSFEVRERAGAELARMAEQAEAELRKVLEGNPSVEVRSRIERLLEAWQRPTPSAARLRQLRALEVLEATGTPEARQLLEKIVGGAPGAWLTRQARATLERLQKRQR